MVTSTKKAELMANSLSKPSPLFCNIIPLPLLQSCKNLLFHKANEIFKQTSWPLLLAKKEKACFQRLIKRQGFNDKLFQEVFPVCMKRRL